jgi:hypothetical protein
MENENTEFRQATSHRLQHAILAAVALVAIAAIFLWGYRVESEKRDRLKRIEEARRKELSVPVVGQGGVSVREVAGCSDELDWGKTSQVKKIARDGDNLVVHLLANQACGSLRAVQPRADVAGNSVILGWSWQMPKDGPLAACICTRHLEFRIPGIPPGDLNVTVTESVQTIK